MYRCVALCLVGNLLEEDFANKASAVVTCGLFLWEKCIGMLCEFVGVFIRDGLC